MCVCLTSRVGNGKMVNYGIPVYGSIDYNLSSDIPY